MVLSANHIAYIVIDATVTLTIILLTFFLYDKYQERKTSPFIIRMLEYLKYLDEKYDILKLRNERLTKLNKRLAIRGRKRP